MTGIVHGDCVEVMAGMEPESVDAIVTDPPYGLEFMGKSWDRLWNADQGSPDWALANGRPSGRKGWSGYPPRPQYQAGTAAQAWHEAWAREALRVAKPGAYLLAFGGTRTVHRLACAIEDAGWIIRDTLVWAYAQGFPKSKASLKPAWEPIVMARKPGPLRELAIDACRIGTEVTETVRSDGPDGTSFPRYGKPPGVYPNDVAGRWPANVILTDPIFDGGIEGVVGGGQASTGGDVFTPNQHAWMNGGADPFTSYGDTGTYSRFFLIPKADRADREPVLGGLPLGNAAIPAGPVPGMPRANGSMRGPVERANTHPTVKPTELMRHLVRLVTPFGGTVLDPFLGSGTTALACEAEGFDWVGIEKDAESVAIARARLPGTQRGLGLA